MGDLVVKGKSESGWGLGGARFLEGSWAIATALLRARYPIRMAVSEDDGGTWTKLKPIGGFGGVVTMASVIELKSGPGHYLAFFHAVELLPDGTLVSTTYGHWTEGEPPYIVSVRFRLAELDRKLQRSPVAGNNQA